MPLGTKSPENVLLQKFENNSMIIVFTWDWFDPFRNIIHSHKDVGVAKGCKERSHEVNAPDIEKIND